MQLAFDAPNGLHPQTADLVARFAQALAEKLHKAEKKYGYSNGWLDDDWQRECANKLVEHVQKGDPATWRRTAPSCGTTAGALRFRPW